MMKTPDQTLTLEDGRQLGFIETGDLKGKPLFLFHGLHSSRLEAKCVEDEMSKKGIRLICFDRPGMGLSTFQKSRKVLDIVEDTLALAKHLKLDTFTVLGVSSGAKYALACAYKVPHRLHSCNILSGAVPMEYITNEVPRYNRFFISLMQMFPRLTKVIFWLLYGRYSQSSSTSDTFLAQIIHVLDTRDKQLFYDKKIKANLLRAFYASYLQGSDGIAYDAGFDIQKSSWGFEPEEIDFSPIHFWHGGKDKAIPFSMAEQLIEKIPHATHTYYPDEGHLSLIFNKIDEVMELLSHRVK